MKKPYTETQPKASEPAWKRWYKTARWQKLRASHLGTEPLCRMCKAEGTITAASVCDHVIAHKGNPTIFWGGPFQSLCASHHNSDKQRMEKGGKARQRIGPDGWPIG